jgi:hypothetical protein
MATPGTRKQEREAGGDAPSEPSQMQDYRSELPFAEAVGGRRHRSSDAGRRLSAGFGRGRAGFFFFLF